MAELLPGAPVAERLTQDLKARSDVLRQRGVTPTLAIIRVGRDPGGLAYEKGAASRCAKCGIDLRRIPLDDAASLPEVIRSVNDDPAIHGCLLLRPLADKAAEEAAGRLLSPDKDVDGFTPVNVGRMVIGEECFLPCTPAGCIEMLKSTGVPIAGKDAVVIGRSNIVGKPAALLLTANNATVTLCHSKTRDLKAKCAAADIIVAAIGKAGFVTADMVKEGAVVIDVGINRNAEGKLCGDVDFAPVAEKAAYITPVPGGVGLMTRAMLMKNTVKAARLQSGL